MKTKNCKNINCKNKKKINAKQTQKKWTDISQILITQHHYNKIKIYSEEHILFIEQYEYHYNSIRIRNIEDQNMRGWSPMQSSIIDYVETIESNFSKISYLQYSQFNFILNKNHPFWNKSYHLWYIKYKN